MRKPTSAATHASTGSPEPRSIARRDDPSARYDLPELVLEFGAETDVKHVSEQMSESSRRSDARREQSLEPAGDNWGRLPDPFGSAFMT